eukprot:gene7478-biopygen16555
MNFVIFGRPAWPPQPPGPRAPGCQQSSHFIKASLGGGKRRKRSRKTLVGKHSAGTLHRLFRRFERARSGVRTAETRFLILISIPPGAFGAISYHFRYVRLHFATVHRHRRRHWGESVGQCTLGQGRVGQQYVCPHQPWAGVPRGHASVQNVALRQRVPAGDRQQLCPRLLAAALNEVE